MANPTLLQDTVTDPHLAELINQAFSNTWFCCDGTSLLARARKGTKPGDALADLLFNLAFLPTLKAIRDYLLARGFVPELLEHADGPCFAQPAD